MTSCQCCGDESEGLCLDCRDCARIAVFAMRIKINPKFENREFVI